MGEANGHKRRLANSENLLDSRPQGRWEGSGRKHGKSHGQGRQGVQGKELDVVTEDPEYRTYYGNMHYLQILERDHPLIMRPATQYRLALSFEPDIAFADE